jgi:hypothetical protein
LLDLYSVGRKSIKYFKNEGTSHALQTKQQTIRTSTGTLRDRACLMVSASIRLATGSGLPPCLTAMMILLPNTALILVFLASVFDLVFALTAAARPMKRGDNLCCCCDGVLMVVDTPGLVDAGGDNDDKGANPETSWTPRRSNAQSKRFQQMNTILGKFYQLLA